MSTISECNDIEKTLVERDEAIRLIIMAYHLAEKSTPTNLRRAIINAEKMLNGDDYEPYH